jgi:MYXO-CTERM domain-containing protein
MKAHCVAVLVAAMLAAASSGAQAGVANTVGINCAATSTIPGGSAQVTISLAHGPDVEVAGTQNDLQFDTGIFTVTQTDCAINPAIGADTEPGKQLDAAVSDGRLRALILSLDNTNPIPAGDLYTCAFHVAAETALGNYEIVNTNLVASSPTGERFPVEGDNCQIEVVAPTPTPTPECTDDTDCPPGQVCVDQKCVVATPTPTPIGYCTSDDDCPAGQVCVNNRCVTPTPTPTPIGYCTSDDDCPAGQVCVDNRCVTPTPTPTPIGYCTSDDDCPSGEVCIDNMCVAVTPTVKKSGGGGCSCKIDPDAPTSRLPDMLAVLLPALMLALRRRARRARA